MCIEDGIAGFVRMDLRSTIIYKHHNSPTPGHREATQLCKMLLLLPLGAFEINNNNAPYLNGEKF
jgi:hypothetical protein